LTGNSRELTFAVPPVEIDHMKSLTIFSGAAFEEHRALLWIVALQIAVSWWMCIAAGRPLLVGLDDAYVAVVGATIIFGAMALATRMVRRRSREIPFLASYRQAWRQLRQEIFTRSWATSVGILLFVMPLSLAVFSAAKQTIPVIHPFAWDAAIEQVGRRMHGGRHMWQWLQPIVGHPTVTIALDEYYHMGWALLVLGTLALVIVSPPSALRQRYITASVLLLFLVGTLVALALSSAGPPYYDHVVYGPDPYAQLFAYLGTVGKVRPLMSSGGRDALWAAYRHGVDAFGLGISAMPSMHVATATLVACLAFAVSPWLGLAASVCTVLMAIASIALGWHYALDGYVGALLAIVVWWIAGWMERLVAAPSRTLSDGSAIAWSWFGGRLAPANLRQGRVPVGSASSARASTKDLFERPMATRSHHDHRTG
jgi:hypothetical protein